MRSHASVYVMANPDISVVVGLYEIRMSALGMSSPGMARLHLIAH
jgi:hypothetical protein